MRTGYLEMLLSSSDHEEQPKVSPEHSHFEWEGLYCVSHRYLGIPCLQLKRHQYIFKAQMYITREGIHRLYADTVLFYIRDLNILGFGCPQGSWN